MSDENSIAESAALLKMVRAWLGVDVPTPNRPSELNTPISVASIPNDIFLPVPAFKNVEPTSSYLSVKSVLELRS